MRPLDIRDALRRAEAKKPIKWPKQIEGFASDWSEWRWRTASQTDLKVEEMSDDHIQNAHRILVNALDTTGINSCLTKDEIEKLLTKNTQYIIWFKTNWRFIFEYELLKRGVEPLVKVNIKPPSTSFEF